jgi:hypothetical protein
MCKQSAERLPFGIYHLIDRGNGGNAGTGIVDAGSGVTGIGELDLE